MSDVLLLTSEEVESLTGIRNPVLAGQELLKKGLQTKWVIVKMSAKGSILITMTSISCAPAFKTLYSKNRKEKMELLGGLTIGKDNTVNLSPLHQEVLIVWGDHDQIFLLEKATELRELLGEKARLEVIKDTAHAPQIENPRQFNNIVYKFLIGSSLLPCSSSSIVSLNV